MRKFLTIGGALTLAAGVAGWLFLAPTSLGGHTTYVVTHGVSMQPTFHTGDLAILRAQPAYHVGEVVAYHSQALHTVVMHRIVGQEGDTFVFKGDNNSWLDPDHPTQADMLGSLALRVPSGGRYVDLLHSTRGRLIAGGLLALLLLGGASQARRQRALRTSGPPARGGRRRAGRHRAPSRPGRAARPRTPATPPDLAPVAASATASATAPAPDRPTRRLAQTRAATNEKAGRRPARSAVARSQVAGAALLLIACVAGELWLWRVPPTAPTSRSVSVTQQGTFGYSASAPASLVYPDGSVDSGEPIYTKIVRSIDFSFDYMADASMHGDLTLSAILVEPSGWQVSLAAGPAEPVTAGRGRASVRVDLDAARAAIGQFEAATGLRGSTPSLVVKPSVQASGAVGGQRVESQLPGELRLAFGADQLKVAPGDAAGAGGAASDPMTITAPLSVTIPATGPRELGAFGRHLTVRTAREAVGAACVVALGLLVVTLIMSRREGKAEDDVAIARRQYGDRIVDADSIPLEGPVVELTSLAALHSVAERYDRVILHSTRGERHSYVVRDELSWYRYEIRPDRGQHAATRRRGRDAGAAGAVGVEAAVIALQPRPRTLDIVPGGVGAATWADGFADTA